jgi:hypothetical protein
MQNLAGEIVIVYIDDWCAVYHDEKRVFQGHTVRLQDLQTVLPKYTRLSDIREIWLDGTDVEQWAYDCGGLPDDRNLVVKILEQGVDAV